MNWDFLNGFWGYISKLEWWQGTILIVCILTVYLMGKFWKSISSKIVDRLVGTSDVLQYRMFQGLMNDIFLIIIKNEIRRSIKDNGFHDISDNEFSQYVKNQRVKIMSLLKEHLISLYPSANSSNISMDDVLDFINNIELEINNIIYDIYSESKRLKKLEIELYDVIDKKFEADIEDFISQNNIGNCKNCLTILFGKREISENNKNKIYTMKSQMVYVESKLLDIETRILSYYSSKLNDKKNKFFK